MRRLVLLRTRQVLFLVTMLPIAEPVWAKVLLRWTAPDVPSADVLGVRNLVISWRAGKKAVERARMQGYDVYAEVTLAEASAAAARCSKLGVSGLIVDVGDTKEDLVGKTVRLLRAEFPRMAFLTRGVQGKQPQMRGSTVIKQEGVFEVSSPTAQPWIDSNTALVALDRAFRPTQVPLISFLWDLSDPVERERGPSVDDYLLAVAEAGALHADLIMDLDLSLQQSLTQRDTEESTPWNRVKRYLKFCSQQAGRSEVPSANVGVFTDDFETSYEVLNLLARRNIPFRVLGRNDLTSDGLKGMDLVVVLARPDPGGARRLADFVAAGGTAVLVNEPEVLPRQSGKPGRTAERAVSYTLGRGTAIELNQAVVDPETFAQDVRRLLSPDKTLLSLWNGLTTLATPYQYEGSSDITLELVNYAEDPLQVQVRFKGTFSAVRYENPENVRCGYLTPTHTEGFTEFVVPWLRVAGRVHLSPRGRVPAAGR